MARYTARMRSTRSVDQAFAFMADLRNFADWDPGVRSVRQVEGAGAGPDGVFDVTVAGPGRDLTLRYRTEEYQPPERIVVVARSRIFTSTDVITVEPDDGGCLVTYDADLRLNGVLALGEVGLRLAFGRIGDRAAAGLRQALDATAVAEAEV